MAGGGGGFVPWKRVFGLRRLGDYECKILKVLYMLDTSWTVG